MAINIFPVPGNIFCHKSQKMGGQVGYLDPGQNKEPTVVRYILKALYPVLPGPSDISVPGTNMTGCGRPCKTGYGPVLSIYHVFELFTYWMTISQVVVVLDQAVEDFFLVCSFNLPYFQRPYLGKIGLKQGLIHLYLWGWGSVYKRIIDFTPWGRKGDMPFPVKFKHETPGNHVPQASVGLNPIPCLAQFL